MEATGIQIPQADLIPESQLAELLGKSIRTIRRWHTQRSGPRRTVLGKSIFYGRESIMQWIAEREEGAA